MESGYFSEWLKSYRNYLRMRNYSPRTLNSYEQVIKTLRVLCLVASSYRCHKTGHLLEGL